MDLPRFPRSILPLLTLLAVSACGQGAHESQSPAEDSPDDTSRSDVDRGRTEDDTKEDDTKEDDTKEDDTEEDDGLPAAETSGPISCVSEDTFEDVSELPPELALPLRTASSFEIDGETTIISMRSGIEDDGFLFWLGSAGDDAYNVLLDVSTDEWTLITGETHEPRVAVGGEFLSFEKAINDIDFSVGHRFDPVTTTWSALPALGSPLFRQGQLEVLTESGYFVWGGLGKLEDATQYSLVADGGYLDASTWDWTPVSTTGAPSLRRDALAVSTSELVLIYGGSAPADTASTLEPLSDGYRYDIRSNSWSPMSTVDGLPQGGSVAVGFGEKMLVIGRHSEMGTVGAIYEAQSDTWSFANMTGGPPTSTLRNLTPPGSLSQLVLMSSSGPLSVGEALFIYDVRADSWRSHYLSEVVSEVLVRNTPQIIGGPSNMDYFWHEGSLIIWKGSISTLTNCNEATRAANPGVGCDALEDVYPLNDGKRLYLSCPD